MSVTVDTSGVQFDANGFDFDEEFIVNLLVGSGEAKAPLVQAFEDVTVRDPVYVDQIELRDADVMEIKVTSGDVEGRGESEEWQFGDTKYRVVV